MLSHSRLCVYGCRKDVNTVNENYESALHMLARDTTATAQAVLFLLQLGADVDQVNGEGESALHMIPIVETDTSAESGNHNQILQKATVLINHGANVNAVDNEGCTPIMYAATAKDDLSGPLIQLLTSAGANSQLADMNGETALMKAAASAQSEAVLRQLGVNISNINLQDCTGQSALHHCLADEVDSSQNSTASTLLDMGASVLTQDQDGCNALHLAVRASDASPDLVRRIANLVKEQGAISMTDNYGQTALMLALDNAEVDGIAIVELLLSFGCAVNRR